MITSCDDNTYHIHVIKYNFRAEQRVSSNLIGRAAPCVTLYKPLKAVYITFLRHGGQLGMNFSFIWKTSLEVQDI